MDHLAAYLSHLANERGLSRLTCENYARDIRTLQELGWLDARLDNTRAEVTDYIRPLEERHRGGPRFAPDGEKNDSIHGLAGSLPVGVNAPARHGRRIRRRALSRRARRSRDSGMPFT